MHPILSQATSWSGSKEFIAIALPIVLGLVGIYLLMPRPRGGSVRWGATCAIAGLLLAGLLLFRREGVDPEVPLFFIFSSVAIASGCLLITQKNPVKAALSFTLVIMSTCGLFLLQAAPFLMAATTIVYAGAIIVTFIFVIMLAQQSGQSDADARSREPLLSSIAGFLLLAAILFVLQGTYGANEGDPDFADSASRYAELAPPGSVALSPYSRLPKARPKGVIPKVDREPTTRPENIPSVAWRDPHGRAFMPAENVAYLGRSLFIDFLLAVEVGGTLLTIATVGAIAITARKAEETR